MAFLRTARRLRFSSTFIVIQYGAVEETVRMSGKAARNMIGINCFSSWDDDSTGMNRLKRMTLKYFHDSRFRGRNFTQGWFGAMLVHEGLKNAGRDLNGEAFVEGLQKIKDLDTQGVCGIITFTPNDHKSIEYHRIYRADVDNNRLLPITGWRKPKE